MIATLFLERSIPQKAVENRGSDWFGFQVPGVGSEVFLCGAGALARISDVRQYSGKDKVQSVAELARPDRRVACPYAVRCRFRRRLDASSDVSSRWQTQNGTCRR